MSLKRREFIRRATAALVVSATAAGGVKAAAPRTPKQKELSATGSVVRNMLELFQWKSKDPWFAYPTKADFEPIKINGVKCFEVVGRDVVEENGICEFVSLPLPVESTDDFIASEMAWLLFVHPSVGPETVLAIDVACLHEQVRGISTPMHISGPWAKLTY